MECPPTARARGDEIRRLDWRFLLPMPELRRVAFLGPVRSTLLSALWANGCDVVTSAPPQLSGYDRGFGQFDLCVVQSAREADVDRAVRLLAPGGWLYWEITRANPLTIPLRLFTSPRARDGRRFLSLSRGRRLLERSGLAAIRASWHHPDFDSCRWIVPLDSAAGLRHVSRKGPAFLQSIRAWVAARIVAAALFPGMGSSVSFVARKPVPTREKLS